MCGHLIADVIRAKRRTYKLRMTHILQGVIPPEPNCDASCVHLPPVDAPIRQNDTDKKAQIREHTNTGNLKAN